MVYIGTYGNYPGSGIFLYSFIAVVMNATYIFAMMGVRFIGGSFAEPRWRGVP